MQLACRDVNTACDTAETICWRAASDRDVPIVVDELTSMVERRSTSCSAGGVVVDAAVVRGAKG